MPKVYKIFAYSRVAANCSAQWSSTTCAALVKTNSSNGFFLKIKIIKIILYIWTEYSYFTGCVLWHMCKPPVHRDPFTSVKVRTTLSSKLIKTYIIILARFPTNHFIKAASSNRTNVIPLKKQICWIRFKCSFLLPSFHI